MDADADFKNALPGEVADETDSDMPRELHSAGETLSPLSEREARAAGMTVKPDVVYGESDDSPNRDDQIDEHRGSEAIVP